MRLSTIRHYLGPVPCLLGWHDWSEPTLVSRVGISGERQDDGSWERETTPQHKAITQDCDWCARYRDRPDLLPKDCWNAPSSDFQSETDAVRCTECDTVSSLEELADGWALTCPSCGQRSRTGAGFEEI